MFERTDLDDLADDLRDVAPDGCLVTIGPGPGAGAERVAIRPYATVPGHVAEEDRTIAVDF
jgi:hypothetical protein